MMRGYLTQMLHDGATAEEVTQQVMLEVWQRRASFDPSRSSMSSWVMMIARSRAIDQLRRHVPEPHDPIGDGHARGPRGAGGGSRPTSSPSSGAWLIC